MKSRSKGTRVGAGAVQMLGKERAGRRGSKEKESSSASPQICYIVTALETLIKLN